MRWQKTARIAIAIAVIAFTVIVFLALRRNRPAPTPSASSPRTTPDAAVESLGPIKHQRYKDGKLMFAVVADGHTTYPDGRTRLQKAGVTLPDRGGQTLQITADEMELTAPPDKTTELGTAKMKGNVRMTSSDRLEVTTDVATFDQPTGMLTVPGAVQFSRERLEGSGLGATYDQKRDVLWLLKDARVSVAPDPTGQGAIEGSANSAGFARADHYLRLTGAAKLTGDGRTAEGDDITIQLSDDEKRIRTMQLRGNSRITGSGAPQQNMAARDIDLTYGEDGRAIQRVTLVENASVELPGAPGAPGRRVAGRTIDMAMAPDGTTLTNLTATERVEVDLPAAGEASARRITAASLAATGPPSGGLQAATFTGNVEYRETRPAAGTTPASERIARSHRLLIETKPGFGELQQADFRGNVRFEDGPTKGEAPRGVYRVTEDTLHLSPSTGDPGPPPRISDDRMAVDAGTLTLALKTRKLQADTNVRSSLQPGKSSGRADGADESGRLPSMLKSDEPVFVNSQKLEYDGASTAVYTGGARLFQGQTTVAGETITLDDRSGNMTAEGKVRTVMFFDDVDPKTKERKPAQTVGTADRLVYADAKRLATYTTGPTAHANIVGPQGDVSAETIHLFLKPKVNELERAEADGKVTVKEGQRTARGGHLTYTSSDETYVMKGNPLEVDRFAPGECTRTMGVTLRFRRGDDNLIVDGIPGVTPFNTKPIPCQTPAPSSNADAARSGGPPR
jgi:LPS export ABC transporter protein LptC